MCSLNLYCSDEWLKEFLTVLNSQLGTQKDPNPINRMQVNFILIWYKKSKKKKELASK